MSEQDAVELAQQELALARMGDEMDMANWVIDYADALIQALEASQQENVHMFWLLDEARQCLRSVDKKEVFGFGRDGQRRWLLVDELLSKIDAALEEQEAQDE